MNINLKLLDNYNRPKRKLKSLKAIIIHWTANLKAGANAMANRNYFNTKPYIYQYGPIGKHKIVNGQKVIVYASAHYIVDDKQIVQCLPDDEVGYHVGAKSYKNLVYSELKVPQGDSPNNYTIGIEMCVNSDGDFNITRRTTIELTKYLLEKHNLTTKQVFRHFDITGKDCPKMMLDNQVWNDFLKEIDGINKVRVNTQTLNVRKGAGTQHPIVRKLSMNDVVEKIGEDGLWYKIGNDEWIHSHYVVVL